MGETVDNTGINTSKRALGQYLYEARLKAGYTQLSAADRVSEWLGNSFGPTTLSKIESGTRTLSFSEARALARTYGLSLDQIAEFDNDAPLQAKAYTVGLNVGELCLLLDRFADLSRRVTKGIDTFVNQPKDPDWDPTQMAMFDRCSEQFVCAAEKIEKFQPTAYELKRQLDTVAEYES